MLTPKQKDTITEIINIGVGQSSASLSEMVNKEILLNVPYVNVIAYENLSAELQEMSMSDVYAVELKFFGEYDGLSNVVLSGESAKALTILLTDMDAAEDLHEMIDGIMIEVGNIILNAVMGTFGNILQSPLEYEIPKSFNGNIDELFRQLDPKMYSQILICRTDFSIKGEDIHGEILIMYEINSFNKLKSVLDKLIQEAKM